MHRVRLAVRENPLRSAIVTEADYLPYLEAHGRGWVIEADGEVAAFAIGDARDGNIWRCSWRRDTRAAATDGACTTP
jgi:hypothetical protein